MAIKRVIELTLVRELDSLLSTVRFLPSVPTRLSAFICVVPSCLILKTNGVGKYLSPI